MAGTTTATTPTTKTTLLHRIAGLSPFGPIFGKELRTTARRKRSYVLRVAYLGLLLIVLLMVYAAEGRSFGGLAARAQRQAELGGHFFIAFAMFSVITMGLIGPVLTCTAVGSERLAKTLPVLLMTPINTWQILTGKLLSRLLAALTLLGLSLPVLALVRLLGGVEIWQMAAVLCTCTTFVLSCAAVGLFFSTLMNRAYAVILLSYVTLGVLYALVPFVLMVGMGLHERRHAGIIADINPVFATVVQVEPRMRMMFPDNWAWCSVVQLGLTAVLLTASAAVLRRIARTAGERPAEVNPESYIPIAAVAQPLAADPSDAPAGPHDGLAPPPLPRGPAATGPVVAYATPLRSDAPGVFRVLFAGPFWVLGYFFGIGRLARARGARRDVSDNPVLWREVQRPLLARPWQRVVATAVSLTILLIIYACIGNDLDEWGPQIGFAIVFGGLTWLLVSVLSATAVTGEKESDTWTLLLAAPLSGRQIVWGKAAGLARRMVWPLGLIAAHFALFIVTGVIHPMSLPLVLWVIVTFNSVWLATGVFLSLRMRRVTFAVIANLMLAILVYTIPYALLFVFASIADLPQSDQRDWVTAPLWYLPYFFLGEGMNDLNRGHQRFYTFNSYIQPRHSFSLPGMWNDVSPEGFFGAVFLIGLLHLLVAYAILARTAASFDQVVGRAGRQAHVGTFDTDEAVIPVGPAAAYAPLWRRLAAALMDGALLRACGALLGLVAGLVAAINLPEDASPRAAERLFRDYALWGVVLSFVAAWPYYALFESSRRRATPGKIAMGLFVADADGRRVTFGAATRRFFGKFFSSLLLFIGHAFALTDPQQRTLYDRVARTVVLKR